MADWEQFQATYRRMVDEELIELARHPEELAPEAQMALSAELAARGIAVEAPEPPRSRETAGEIPEAFLDQEEPVPAGSELVAVFSAEDDEEAHRAAETLRQAGIDCQHQIVILVAQADAERAIEVLGEELDSHGDGDEEEM